jgi:uncharacterized protein YgiM (DUF1202 family)
MKRLSTVLVLALISVFLIPSSAQAAPIVPAPQAVPHFDGIPGVVVVATLNVRRAPRISSSVIGKLKLNDKILVLGKTYTAAWVFIAAPFGNGWVDRSFIRMNGTVRDLPISNVFPPFLTVTAAPSVNVRMGPGELYPVVARLPPGVGVDVLATFRRASWYQIAMPGFGPIGWVRSDTAIVDGDPSSVPELPREPVLATVSSYRVRVHRDPKLDSPSIGTVRLAQYFLVVGADVRGNWWLIQGPFGAGWVLAAYVKIYGDYTGLPAYETEPLNP